MAPGAKLITISAKTGDILVHCWPSRREFVISLTLTTSLYARWTFRAISVAALISGASRKSGAA
jgi:hypothetical protein